MGLIFEKESYAIRGAAFEVYKEKGCGFLEAVYQECLEIELGLQSIPHLAKPKLQLEYKGIQLKKEYEPDLIVHGKIILELKAVSALSDENRAQLHNYLRSTGFQLGFLINFGHHPKVDIERIVK